MAIGEPPIQDKPVEVSTQLFPQTWLLWFQAVTREINSSSGGGSVNWGDIGGTLSDQTDLQSALNAKDDLVQATSTITTSQTIDLTFRNVFVDASSGAVTVTLPSSASSIGRYFNIKKIDTSSNVVTIDPNGSETIDKLTTQTLTASTRPSLQIVSDGTEWWIV